MFCHSRKSSEPAYTHVTCLLKDVPEADQLLFLVVQNIKNGGVCEQLVNLIRSGQGLHAIRIHALWFEPPATPGSGATLGLLPN